MRQITNTINIQFTRDDILRVFVCVCVCFFFKEKIGGLNESQAKKKLLLKNSKLVQNYKK